MYLEETENQWKLYLVLDCKATIEVRYAKLPWI